MKSSIKRSVHWGVASVRLLILCGAVVTPSVATDHFNLESRIPVTIEDIEPIERGGVELQGFGTFLRMRQKNIGQAAPRLALGILDNTQLEIAAPFLLGQGAAIGNGDVQVSMLRKFWDAPPEKWRPGFALEADVTLPTGTRKRGLANRTDAGLTALLKKQIAGHSFHLNAGFEWSGDDTGGEPLRRVVWSGAVGHHTALTKRLVLVSDLAWSQADEKQTTDIWLLESGVRAQISRRMIGAVGVGAGLNRGPNTPTVTLTFGFQIGL